MLKQKENIMGTVIICGAVAVLMVILAAYTVKHWKKNKKCPSADGHFLLCYMRRSKDSQSVHCF